MQRKVITPENALVRLETLCARSERCTHELMTKLRMWGISGADAERILDDLVDRRFVDDERFTHSFVADKFRFSGHGRLKIRAALLMKRIPDRIIKEAFDEVIVEEEYRSTLDRILRAKAARLDGLDTFEGRTKLFRFGVSRGYEPSLVGEMMKPIVRELLSGGDE